MSKVTAIVIAILFVFSIANDVATLLQYFISIIYLYSQRMQKLCKVVSK